jgi:hypothetical protein
MCVVVNCLFPLFEYKIKAMNPECKKCSVTSVLNEQINCQKQIIVKQNIIINLLKAINAYSHRWGRLHEKHLRN